MVVIKLILWKRACTINANNIMVWDCLYIYETVKLITQNFQIFIPRPSTWTEVGAALYGHVPWVRPLNQVRTWSASAFKTVFCKKKNTSSSFIVAQHASLVPRPFGQAWELGRGVSMYLSVHLW